MKQSFDRLTEAALNHILFTEYEHPDAFTLSGYENGQAVIIVDSNDAFERRLIFHDARITEGVEISDYYSDFRLTEQEDGYYLEFEQSVGTENPASYKMFFSTANVKIKCFNYTKSIIPYYEPWHLLVVYLNEMRNKRGQFGMEYLNEEEKKMYPLSDFIPLMQHFGEGFQDTIIFEAENNSDADVLKEAEELFVSYAERAQVREIEKLARQYAEFPAGSNNKRGASRKLQRAFTGIEGEPLYHLILNEIRDAGARYPDRIDSIGKSADADEARERISSFFHSQGFEGAYPFFRKISSFKGLRMIQMENPVDAEIFWNEKNMVSLINCCESCIDGELAVSYVAGTVFLKNNQAGLFHSLTADSGFFKDKKKRRRGRAIINQPYRNYSGYLSVQDENLKAAEIASRVSQCERVSKEERKEYFSLDFDNIGIIVSVVFGLLFSIILCIAFVPMAIVAGWIIEGVFPLELLLGIPWHLYILFSGLGSGIAMFLLLTIGRRRG